jgi:hypothetical protein
VDDFTIMTAAARLGSAFPGGCSPWTAVVAAGADHALAWNLALSVGVSSNVRGGAMSHRTVVSPLAQPVSGEHAPLPQFAAKRGAKLLPTTVTVTRKPMNAHKTRINAGGYGAMGPHPERERLA